MRARREFAVTLLAQLLGAAAVLLLASRIWQTARTPRERPLADDVLDITGRAIDTAPTALALVALAGVVAVLASRGVVRRVVGVLIAAAGAAMIWRVLAAGAAVSSTRAAELVREAHPAVGVHDAAQTTVTVHPLWAVLSVIAAVLVLAAGLLIAWRGAAWATMSSRYQRTGTGTATSTATGTGPGPGTGTGTGAGTGAAPGAGGAEAAQRGAASMWAALERGEDPTDTGRG